MTVVKRRWPRKLVLGAILPLVVLVVWHVASKRSVLVPSIGSVLDVLANPFREPPDLDSSPLAAGVLVSVLRVVLGFGLAIVTAIPLGLWIGRSRLARDLFSPTLAAIMAISPIAWLPVTILIFGLSSPATVLYGQECWRADILDQLRFAVIGVIWLSAFFPIAMNAAAGARSVRQSYIETVRVLGGTRWQVLTKAIIPSAAPSVTTGLQIGGMISWRAIVAAEIFPGTQGGLGYMISTAQHQGSYRYAFAALIVIGLIGLLLDGGLRLLAWRVGRWQVKQK